MSARSKLLSAFVIGIAGGFLAGCQTYDFEPVEPLAISQTTDNEVIVGRQLKPNVMFLIDKSGSMLDPVEPSDPDCGNCGSSTGVACNEATCPTRWGELKNAMGTFFTTYGTVARMGATFYPKKVPNVTAECEAPMLDDIEVHIPNSDDVDAELQASATAIHQQINAISRPEGGTPTGNSLLMLSQYPAMLDSSDGRQKFIIVLTDGLPNCNAENANSYLTDPATCRCTLASDFGCQAFDRKGCLDKNSTVAQVANLKAAGIKTVVIGFGAETASGDGPEVLNAMAEAGGFARACKDGTDAECGGAPGSCDQATKTCTQKFYQAKNGDELARALADISRSINPEICKYNLSSAPSDPAFLSVLVNGENVKSGADTWRYEAGSVIFQGALCNQLENSDPTRPITVEFRAVQTL